MNIVEVIDEKSLRVDEDLTEFSQTYDDLVSSNIVFVYGEEVDDFLNLIKREVFFFFFFFFFFSCNFRKFHTDGLKPKKQRWLTCWLGWKT